MIRAQFNMDPAGKAPSFQNVGAHDYEYLELPASYLASQELLVSEENALTNQQSIIEQESLIQYMQRDCSIPIDSSKAYRKYERIEMPIDPSQSS